MAQKNFVTKATNLKIKFLKSPWKMNLETCHDICLKKQKKITFCYPFLAFFSTFPSAKTIKVIGLIFFSMSWPWKIGLWTCILTLYLFSKAFFLEGGAWDAPPRLYIDSDPPAFIGLKIKLSLYLNLNLISDKD